MCLIRNAKNHYFEGGIPVKLLGTVQKVPGGTMVIPLLLGVLCNTFFPNALKLGGLTTATFSSAGANSIMGVFLVCVGSQIRLAQAPEVLKRGFGLLGAKFLAGASLGWAAGALFGVTGVFGISSLALISAVTNSNGGLFMSLAAQFGDEQDIGAQAILNINDGPFLTLVALGASGIANIPFQNLLAAIAPILIGCLLGNLDKDLSDFFKPALNILIPFFAFCLGAGISLGNLVKAGAPGIVLGVFCIVWSGFICILMDKFILRRPGYAGAAVASAAGNCVGTPAAVALATTRFAPDIIEQATAQCAAAVIVTVIGVPLLTTWAAKRWGTAAQWTEKKAAQKTVAVS